MLEKDQTWRRAEHELEVIPAARRRFALCCDLWGGGVAGEGAVWQCESWRRGNVAGAGR